MAKDLKLLKDQMTGHMEAIAELLPEEYKLTLVARHPTNARCHVVVGDDMDMEAVAYILEHPELIPIEVK